MKPTLGTAADNRDVEPTAGTAPVSAGGGVPAAETLARSPLGERSVPLKRGVPLSALSALFQLTVARLLRGRRLLILAALFALPVLIAVLARRFAHPYEPEEGESVLIQGLIPQALVPLTALLFATGMVQDDVEDQTLTYLLIRPIPRALIYLVKLAATWLVISLLAAVFTGATLVAIHGGLEASAEGLLGRAGVLSGSFALGLLSYVSLFGLLGLLTRRAAVLGVGYIVILEGVIANIDFVLRRATVMYYLRTLSVRWLESSGVEWSIDPATAPTALTCVVVLAAAGLSFALLGAGVFRAREFRMKTPAGS
jgi:ABC-2 type transport system permease protein